MIFNTGIKARAITIVALLMMAIAIGGCTSEINLPILYKAPGFTLTNQDGQEVKLSDFQGKVVVMNFIYSRCPDVCGEENYRLQGVWEKLNKELRQDLVLISVSFDPYDTPEVLKSYETFFNVPGWQFLTGTEDQIRQVTNDYWVSYEQEVGGWEIKHSIVIVLIDRDGMVRKTYGYPEFPQKDMIREIEYLLK